MISTLIGTIIVGAIIGALARIIMPGDQHIGWLRTIGLGVVSSLIVGLIVRFAGGDDPSWIFSVIAGAVVAVILLWLGLRQGWLKTAS